MATGGVPKEVSETSEGSSPRPTTPAEQPQILPKELYKSRVFGDVRKLYQEEELTDVMVAADGQSIPCHKFLLAAASKYFRNKFVSHPETLEHNLLDVEGIDFVTLKAVVSFIYSCEIDLTVEKVKALLPASVRLMIPELTGACKDFLVDRVSEDQPDVSDAITIYRISKESGLQDVPDLAWELMLDRFQDVVQTDAFKCLTETELKEYLQAERLNVINEDPVFEAVMTWVRHDLETREAQFESILKSVQLSHCSLDFLKDTVWKEPLMKDGKCNDQLHKLVEALFCHTANTSMQRGAARAGYKVETLIVVGNAGWEQEDGELNWQPSLKYSLPHGLADAEWYSACMTKDAIVVSGGRINSKPITQCWKLVLDSLTWTVLPDLNEGRFCHTSVALGKNVYVLGGWDKHQTSLSSVECLPEDTTMWHMKSYMPKPAAQHTAVGYKNIIYVFSGFTGSYANPVGFLPTFALDTVSQTWTEKAELPKHCNGGSALSWGNRIYLVGGTLSTRCCFSYEPNMDQWTVLKCPGIGHFGGSAVIWNGRILLCGGQDTTNVEEYDPHTDSWTVWENELPLKPTYSVLNLAK